MTVKVKKSDTFQSTGHKQDAIGYMKYKVSSYHLLLILIHISIKATKVHLNTGKQVIKKHKKLRQTVYLKTLK